jgi:hypothetical protein
MEVASRDQGAQDREGVPHDKLEGLRDRIVQEEPDRRQATCMRYGSQGMGAALVCRHQ